jgi:predicted O-linked N-acetylglucosamine transferase (SPINDLY family)
MGSDYFDYIIADEVVLPKSICQHFAEKVAYLPNSYQVNDAKRQIGSKIFLRSELGLPEGGFVFCCFNNSYKISAANFDDWCQILRAVPGSVLWLLEDSTSASNNLRMEALKRGIDQHRLVFAGRMSLQDHLARHRAADLFLDTLPVNAHTTASDALWAGLPLLTLAGQSFAARVAASLLYALELPELVVTDREAYIAKAIELGNAPSKLQKMRTRLVEKKAIGPLFDSQLFTRHIEDVYTQMHDRVLAGLKPDHIWVKPAIW